MEQSKIKDKAQEDVESFCYPVGTIDGSGVSTAELKARTRNGQAASATLNKL